MMADPDLNVVLWELAENPKSCKLKKNTTEKNTLERRLLVKFTNIYLNLEHGVNAVIITENLHIN